MSSKGRRFSGEQKAKIALEALRGDRTLQEVASKHQVHPNQVGAWKRQAVERLGEVFSNGVERHRRAHESELRELSVGRSSLYYTPKGESAETLARMRPIDERFVKSPFYGARQMVRLMRLLGLQALYRAPRTSDPHPEHRVWPYLVKGMTSERANHVWCADITSIPVRRGFLCLVAIMDWASRHILTWRLPNTLDAGFCVEALEEALARYGTPEIFNTDQGSQFTGFAFTGRLQAAGIRSSMGGRGRWDNLFIERLWRSLKYEAVYVHESADGFTARRVIGEWVGFYNTIRAHSALGGRTPAEAWRGGRHACG